MIHTIVFILQIITISFGYSSVIILGVIGYDFFITDNINYKMLSLALGLQCIALGIKSHMWKSYGQIAGSKLYELTDNLNIDYEDYVRGNLDMQIEVVEQFKSEEKEEKVNDNT